MLQLILALHKFTYSKIADLDITLTRQQNVVQFDVSVEHTFTINIHKPLNQLSEDVLS